MVPPKKTKTYSCCRVKSCTRISRSSAIGARAFACVEENDCNLTQIESTKMRWSLLLAIPAVLVVALVFGPLISSVYFMKTAVSEVAALPHSTEPWDSWEGLSWVMQVSFVCCLSLRAA
jgi:hypothetical protein